MVFKKSKISTILEVEMVLLLILALVTWMSIKLVGHNGECQSSFLVPSLYNKNHAGDLLKLPCVANIIGMYYALSLIVILVVQGYISRQGMNTFQTRPTGYGHIPSIMMLAIAIIMIGMWLMGAGSNSNILSFEIHKQYVLMDIGFSIALPVLHLAANAYFFQSNFGLKGDHYRDRIES